MPSQRTSTPSGTAPKVEALDRLPQVADDAPQFIVPNHDPTGSFERTCVNHHTQKNTETANQAQRIVFMVSLPGSWYDKTTRLVRAGSRAAAGQVAAADDVCKEHAQQPRARARLGGRHLRDKQQQVHHQRVGRQHVDGRPVVEQNGSPRASVDTPGPKPGVLNTGPPSPPKQKSAAKE